MAALFQAPFRKSPGIFTLQCSHFLYLFAFFPSGRPTSLSELMSKAEMWLTRIYWDFEFPRPLLPHFEFVGGLHFKPAKPLPKVTYSCLFCLVYLAFPVGKYLCSLFRLLITMREIWEDG